MRAFKYISMAVLSIWFLAITTHNWLPSLMLINNDYFKSQLSDLNKIDEEKRILVYGSSGLLLGISAESLELTTGRSARNLSTAALGGLIDLAIARISPYIKNGDIVIIGDRSYRKSHREPFSLSEYFHVINKLFAFNPGLRSYSIALTPISRTAHGDFKSYPTANLAPETYDATPKYTSVNIELMRKHIDLVKQSGGCPVLVLVPILVKQGERVTFEAATEQLMSLARSAGISAHVLQTPSIEDDVSFFVNQNHLSELGRAKWTGAISREILARNLCSIGFSPQS